MTAVARWVSIVGHPFVTVAIMVSVAAVHFSTPAQAARILLIVLLITVGEPGQLLRFASPSATPTVVAGGLIGPNCLA